MNISFLPESEFAVKGVVKFFTLRRLTHTYIKTFGSKDFGKQYISDNILNMDINKFYAADVDDQYDKHVGFSFSNHQFYPLAYTIAQYNGQNATLKSWKLQASPTPDSSVDDWEDIDIKESDDYCMVGILPTFNISRQFWKPYSKFRIIQNDLSCKDNTWFRLGGLELFGQISGESIKDKTCLKRIKNIKKRHLLIALFFYYS